MTENIQELQRNWSNRIRRKTCVDMPATPDRSGMKHHGIADVIVSWPQGADMMKNKVCSLPVWYRNGYLFGNDPTFIMSLIMRCRSELRLRPGIDARDIELVIDNFRST
jgi:hypothetical protein